jgi:predicted component of type VI protein secretion system
VRTTIIHGRVVMEDRRLLTVDVAEVRARMRALATRIQTKVARGLP